MTDSSDTPPPSWQHRVSPSRPRPRHRHAFSGGTVTVGAIHIAGLIAGVLAADKMRVAATVAHQTKPLRRLASGQWMSALRFLVCQSQSPQL